MWDVSRAFQSFHGPGGKRGVRKVEPEKSEDDWPSSDREGSQSFSLTLSFMNFMFPPMKEIPRIEKL